MRSHWLSALLSMAVIAAFASCSGDDVVRVVDESVDSLEELSQLEIRAIGAFEFEAEVESTLGDPLEVQVTDGDGAPVRGVEIEWTFTSGGPASGATTTLTGSNGRSQMRWVLGKVAGDHTATATIVLPEELTEGPSGQTIQRPGGLNFAPGKGREKTTTFTVKVRPGSVSDIDVTPQEAMMSVGAFQQLQATVTDANGNVITGATVTWASSDSTIARVDGTGLVEARSAGIASVVAKIGATEGPAFLQIEGTPPPPAPTPPPSRVGDLQVASVTDFTATVRWTAVDDGTGTGANYALRRSAPPMAWGGASTQQVLVPGVRVGNTVEYTWGSLAAGTAYEFQLVAYRGALGDGTVFSELSNIAAGTTTSTATPPPPAQMGTVEVLPSSSVFTAVGGTVQLRASASDSVGAVISSTTFSFTSTNPSVATVSSAGLVTAQGFGSAYVVVSSDCCTPDTSQIVVQAPPSLPSDAVLFTSAWDAATGNSQAAVLDAGAWSEVVCSDAFPQVLQVVPGSQAGWTRTPNVMQVTNRGSRYCGQVNAYTSIPQVTDFYVRFYARVEDENTSNFHPVAVNCCGDIQWVPWSIDMGAATAGQTYAPVMGVPTPQGQPYNSWRPRQLLQMRQWYRFEYHIQYIDRVNLRARIWPRVYDMNGTLLYDANSFVSVWDGGANVLGQFYASGGYVAFRNADLARRFAMGYEGSAIATDQGRRWFYADVEIRSDTWPGP